MSNSKELIKEIRDRIQFLVTAEIFFSTLIYVFYKTIGSNEIIANNNALFWGIGVAFCMINYLIIGAGEEFNKKVLLWIRNVVSLNIFLFILPMLVLVLVAHQPLPDYYKWIFSISLGGSIWMPIATFLFIGGVIIWTEVSWIRKLFKK